MKKNYIKPSLLAYTVKSTEILAGSLTEGQVSVDNETQIEDGISIAGKESSFSTDFDFDFNFENFK